MKKALLPPLIGAGVFLVLGYLLGVRSGWTLLTLAFGGYAAQVTIGEMFLPMLQRMRRGESAGAAFVEGQLIRGRRRFGSYIVHAAMVVVIIAIAVSSSMRQTTELHFTRGQTQAVSGYELTFLGVDERQEPHRSSIVGRFALVRDGKQVAVLEPRMNQYERMREPIGSPDVHTTAAGDFYISLSNIDQGNQTASITVFVAPLIVWIWLAVVAMGLGALISLIPARERRLAASEAKESALAPETA
jgi:cytochrome c-type biogenesis protein CcmF